MKQRHVIIVGGGASGLVAAIAAARHGAKVTIVEKKDILGKKILATGNGRCNLTNEYMEVSCFRGDDTEIVAEILKEFGYQKVISFFEHLGVMMKSRQGYIYPLTEQASTILDVLCMEITRHHDITVLLNQTVTKVRKEKKGFVVKTKSDKLQGDAVILATGGKASPVLGSDGSGYVLAKQLGHHLSPVVPALVQLKGKGNFFKQLAGIRTNAKVSVFVDGECNGSDVGELQLTNYGISGIPVFQISRFAAKGLHEGRDVRTEIDFLPNVSEEELETFLAQRVQRLGYKKAGDFFIGLFHQKLIRLFLKIARISEDIQSNAITPEQWQLLRKVIKHFFVEITDTNGFEQAQVCAGGVFTTEINAKTLESIYTDDLYLTGELLDIDGICGGYNLHWAWATGYIAGMSAAKGK